MNIVPYRAHLHYSHLKHWWNELETPGHDPWFLPPTGVVVEHEEELICAGFLLKTDAKVATICALVANPKVDKLVRSSAIDLMIESLLKKAVECGFGMVSAATNLKRLQQRFEDFGFIKGDENVTHYGGLI